MKILCIGQSIYDINIPLNGFINENYQYTFIDKISSGGGIAANTAYLLGKWGMETHFAGVIGYDSFGQKIKKELTDNKVNTTFLETNYEAKTPQNIIFTNQNNKSKTGIKIISEEYQLKRYKWDFTPNIIFSDGFEYNASLDALTKFPLATTFVYATSPSKEIQELCKKTKYIIATSTFAQTLTGLTIDFNNPQSLLKIYEDLKFRFKNTEIILCLNEKGNLYTINNSIKIMPSINYQNIDSSGSDDSFCGAFIYAHANGYDNENAVKLATIAAGLAVTKYGARLSIPSLAEVLEYYEKH